MKTNITRDAAQRSAEPSSAHARVHDALGESPRQMAQREEMDKVFGPAIRRPGTSAAVQVAQRQKTKMVADVTVTTAAVRPRRASSCTM